MPYGTLALVFFTTAVFGVLVWLGWIRNFEDEVELNLLVMVFVVGGVGAIVSVMQRAAAGELTLQYHAGRAALRLVGGLALAEPRRRSIRPTAGATPPNNQPPVLKTRRGASTVPRRGTYVG